MLEGDDSAWAAKDTLLSKSEYRACQRFGVSMVGYLQLNCPYKRCFEECFSHKSQ
jgi:hypothetical protein